MSSIRLLGFFLVGLLFCLGLDFAYDAAVVADRSMKFWLHIAMSCCLNVLGATALNIVNGMAGQFSIGHAGFVGVGAYLGGAMAAHLAVALRLPMHALRENLNFTQSLILVPVVLVIVAIVCAILGLIVGLPSLRLRGDYLAIVTLGFSEILRLTILGTTVENAGNPITKGIASLGGALGYRGVTMSNGDFSGIPSVAGPFWIVGVTILVLVFAFRLKSSGFGRALRAVREDEIAASAVGVDPARYKVRAFVLAAIGAGLAGALLAIRRDGPGIVSPANMKFDKSFEVITMVILGGSGSVSGAALGAILYTAVFYASEEGLNQLARAGVSIFQKIDAAGLRMALFAVTLIVVMILRPEGLLGEREVWQQRSKKKTLKPSEPHSSHEQVSPQP